MGGHNDTAYEVPVDSDENQIELAVCLVSGGMDNALTTVSAVVFLYGASSKLASISIVHMDEAGATAAAAAMATLIVATALAVKLLRLCPGAARLLPSCRSGASARNLPPVGAAPSSPVAGALAVPRASSNGCLAIGRRFGQGAARWSGPGAHVIAPPRRGAIPGRCGSQPERECREIFAPRLLL